MPSAARCVDRGEGVAMIIGPLGHRQVAVVSGLYPSSFEKTFPGGRCWRVRIWIHDVRFLQATLYELGRIFIVAWTKASCVCRWSIMSR